MNRPGKYFVLFIGLIMHRATLHAQQDSNMHRLLETLCSKDFKGRGYIENGVNLAADYLTEALQQFHTKPFGYSYTQTYSLAVNTFPEPIICTVDGKEKKAGSDFLVDASSPGIKGRFHLTHFNMKDSLECMRLMQRIHHGFSANEVPVLHHYNAREKKYQDSSLFYHHEPCMWITTEDKKLTYTVSRSVAATPSLIFIDSALQRGDAMQITLKQKFQKKFICKNIAAYIEGRHNDSFMVFSAHYDHLGMMGQAMFPGASDNASGVAMLMKLVAWYQQHPPEYKTVFLLFSGEEAGLVGSSYFTEHPLFPLDRIRLLINLDIMGNAEKGIVMVNGEDNHRAFDKLKALNDTMHAVPAVRIRAQARNSDHYPFAMHGVPAVFIYTDGGPGYYHDVFDQANTLALTHIDALADLLIRFCALY